MADSSETTFDVPWHAPLWRHMASAIESDRVAHGLLVCGPPGVGKRVFAQRLAAALLCRDRNSQANACGQCGACRQRIAGTHPDISRLVPEEPGRLIKVDAVRAFAARLQLTPQYDSGRIGWIEPAEALSISASNSLLKTLEEPPPDCHIVLVADRVSALMATIRSRCQMWRVPPPTRTQAGEWLAQRDVAVDALDADSLRTPFAVLARRERDYDQLSAEWDPLLAGVIRSREDVSAAAARMAEGGADLLADWLYRRASALLALAIDPADRDHGLPEELARIAMRLDPSVFAPWCARVSESARLAQTNADWLLVIESLLFDLKACVKRRNAA